MSNTTAAYQEAIALLKSRPSLASDVLIMAGAREALNSPVNPLNEIERIMRETMLGSEQEMIMVFAVNGLGQLVDSEVLFRGFEGMVFASPKIIFRWLLTRDESVETFYMAHNHPISSPSPSGPDIDLTETILHLSSLLGLRMTDHFILGAGGKITSIRSTVERNLRSYGVAKSPRFDGLSESLISRMLGTANDALAAFEKRGVDLWDVT